MDISEYQNLTICGVRFKTSGEVLTAYQFEYWLKTSPIDAGKPVLEKISLAGADPLYESIPPATAPNQAAEWDGAIQIDGKWYRKWRIVEDEDKPFRISASKLADVRKLRNDLLVASDWTQFNDSPLSAAEKSEWATYRQQLRDITTQDINTIVWPTPPIKAV